MCIVEVTNDCDIHCTTCIANSKPGGGNVKGLTHINGLIGIAEGLRPRPEVLMISGGEPTTHPEIFTILKRACQSEILHSMIITNGIRLSSDTTLANMLAQYRHRLEVYLQFDSITPSVLKAIRGTDLSSYRISALDTLEKLSIPTTLVIVVKQNVNNFEVYPMVQMALRYKCVRGVTFQPIRATGRHNSFEKENDRVNLTDIRTAIIQSGNLFDSEDIIPHPQNPLGICIGYILRKKDTAVPVTKDLFHPNGYFGKSERGKDFMSSMYFLPQHSLGDYNYDDLFRVTVVCCLDKYSFIKEQLNTCNIAFVSDTGEVVPFDTYYLEGEAAHIPSII